MSNEDEFVKKFRLRHCEKCCWSCKHGIDLCNDGVYECVHPCLNGKSILTLSANVCDAWEGCSP